MQENPLVSILIFNYNYGKYLRECIESALAQTYKNVEIIMSDNSSEDDSWDIFVEYEKQYQGKFFIARNRKNFGTDHNFATCWAVRKGTYHVVLGSDDVLEPTFIERTMDVMMRYPNLGYVMCHRSIINESGKQTYEKPFYDQNCVIYPPAQSLVYMMAAVNPSITQILYRSSLLTPDRSSTGGLAGKYYATRFLDFSISIEFPIAYLKEPLIRHRIHGRNQNLAAADDLMEAIGFYVLNIQFADKATQKGYPELQNNFERSVEKISELCLRYALRGLVSGNYQQGKRYWHLSHAFKVDQSKNELANELTQIFENLDSPDISKEIERVSKKRGRLSRSVSYSPPEPYEKIH